MSYGTFFGFLFGLGLFLSAIVLATDNYLLFLSHISLLIVLGGTIANAYISFQARYVHLAFRGILEMFTKAQYEQTLIVSESKRIISWGYIARKDGLLALEQSVDGNKAHDFMLRYGVRLVVDGTDAQTLKKLLDTVVASSFNRKIPVIKVLKNMAATSPAFGMVGTLVGLVVMLDSMTNDPGNLGQGLAVALVTTLYGVLFARLVFQPAADKLMQRSYIEQFRNKLIVKCLCAIADGKPPRQIENEILSMLDPELQLDLSKVRKQMKESDSE
jgi:chemotaxis protein MotA